MHEVSTFAAYQDRWPITGQRGIGIESDVGSTDQIDRTPIPEPLVMQVLAVVG
jgi:hypothetical protein